MHSAAKTLSITQVLACGAAIVTLSMGIRHGFRAVAAAHHPGPGMDA
jgi:hypothetical protein